MVITSLAGGRNGIDSPVDPLFPDDQCVEAVNVDFSQGPLGRKRGGSTALSLTGGTANTTGLRKLQRHLPSGSLTAQELWSIDAVGLIKRLAAGVAWVDITPADAISITDLSTIPRIKGLSFNGKLLLFYPSAVDRMHLWNGTTLRRMSLITPVAAPTVTDQGAGVLPATLRYYRIRWLEVVAGLIIRRSEGGPSIPFTPSGAGQFARITRPTAASESETHWEIDVSLDNINWYRWYSFDYQTSHIPIATTFVDSTGSSAIFVQGPITDVTGLFSPLPSCAFGVTDGNRAIMGGNPTLTARVWWTAVLGSLNKGDDERYISTADLKGYTDLNEKSGGALTAMEGPINGVIFCFKYEQIWRLVPTGDPNMPYVARLLTPMLGCINAVSTALAQDSAGNPAVYFVSSLGIYRYTLVAGLEYMGRDVEDQWYGLQGKSAVNLNATFVSHMMYYPRLQQIWTWVSTGASTSPDTILVLDIRAAKRKDRYGVRGGWSIFTGDLAAAMTACMFSNTPGATMSLDLKPYVGRPSNVVILKADTTDLNDNGTLFQGFVRTKSLVPPAELGRLVVLGENVLLASAGAVGVVLRQSVFKDFEAAASSFSDTPLAPSGSETGTRVIRKFTDGQASDIGVLQLQLGDAAAVAAAWSLDQLDVRRADGGAL